MYSLRTIYKEGAVTNSSLGKHYELMRDWNVAGWSAFGNNVLQKLDIPQRPNGDFSKSEIDAIEKYKSETQIYAIVCGEDGVCIDLFIGNEYYIVMSNSMTY